MTTPNVRCTCTGTCHPEAAPHYWLPRPNMRLEIADVRRWAFYNIGANMCACDTGVMHGPFIPAQLAHRFMLRGARRARILAATDHIGRGRL